jgi:hypothetical protein
MLNLRSHKINEEKTKFSTGDVIAMAIVCESHVIENPNAVEIAQEQLTSLSESGLLEGVKLHPYSEIKVTVADWYFDPDDDLPQMLDERIAALRDRLLSEGEPLGLVITRLVTFQSRSRVVGTCWLGIHILN